MSIYQLPLPFILSVKAQTERFMFLRLPSCHERSICNFAVKNAVLHALLFYTRSTTLYIDLSYSDTILPLSSSLTDFGARNRMMIPLPGIWHI